MDSTPRVLWSAEKHLKAQSGIAQYMQWLYNEKGMTFAGYRELWEWSVKNTSSFWESVWQYFKIKSHTPYTAVCSADPMPHTKWFEGATLNYAAHIFRNKSKKRPALIFCSERQAPISISWSAFEKQTAALQSFLKKEQVGKGDCVAAYLPNIPEASVGLLATIATGAIWSCCSPDFGLESVLDRFRQIAPKVFIAVDGYTYNGKPYSRIEIVKKIKAALPSVEKVVIIPYLNKNGAYRGITDAVPWEEVMNTDSASLTFEPLPFSHPIWILFSSGTTGLPKAITHSHGGMLLEHLKYLSFHNDVKAGEKFFWFTTTGWMMWNFVQASLLTGATMVLYDGSPGYPNMGRLWKLIEETGIHHFGTSAPFILACRKKQLQPGKEFDLSTLRSIGSTGSPLPPEGFRYVYKNIKKEVWLCSMSGGTDVCTAWVGSCILKPVLEGEIQCRCLGASIFAYDESGEAVKEKVGEMVVTRSMPCMPIYFWGDKDFKRYHSSYFEVYPDKWRHGDWIKVTQNDGIVILGRSDATLNRQGVRIGTAEIYRALAQIKEIKDALIVNLEKPDGKDFMPLFVVLEKPGNLTSALKDKIKDTLKSTYSPRHVPDDILEVPDLPYTISGKKMEAPVKKILLNRQNMSSTQKGAMRNPGSLDFFEKYARQFSLK